ncbi:MAG: GTPase HflX [Chloroflexi bacterium]|nr:GTPase HflX [Chloroflexota bacterium]
MPRTPIATRQPIERAILAGVEVRGIHGALSLDDSLEELTQLANTAGAKVVGAVRQRLQHPVRTYLGGGKLEELSSLVQQHQATTVILDDELSPTQQKILEDATHIKVIDRTALILDIFARRAQTREGRLQVELAQHEYLLPRLAGQWSHLERLGGGIGTRGPGESQIETDRRLIRNRIQKLKEQLEEVRRHRALYRERRKQQRLPVLSLVGYTNAGKSTLFNLLGKADTLVQDRLFATLDPVTRRCQFHSGHPFLLTDTVGFIQKLPTALVAAFRATLEELADADVLVHVIDISHPNAIEQREVVDQTLQAMGLAEKRVVLAYNKIDRLAPDKEAVDQVVADLRPRLVVPGLPAAFVSAAKGWGMPRLLETLEAALEGVSRPTNVIEVG